MSKDIEPRSPDPWAKEENITSKDISLTDILQSIDDTLRNLDILLSEKRNRPDFWSHLIGPPLVIASIVSILYVVWSLYCYAYFNRLSIPNQYMNYQNISTMLRILSIVLSLNVILILIQTFLTAGIYELLRSVFNIHLKKGQRLFLNALIFSVVILAFSVHPNIINKYYSIITGILLSLACGVFLAIKIESIYGKKDGVLEFCRRYLFRDNYFKKNVDIILAYAFIITFLVTITLPLMMGEYDSQMLVEGAPGYYQIKFDLNESIPNLNNNTFILVSIQDGNYYFVEKNIHPPPHSELYAIPISKVIKVKITEINDNESIIFFPRQYNTI